MRNIPVAVQAYSVRHDIEKDLAGTLKAIKEMGYDGVEFFGDYKTYDPAELKKLLDENGLAIVGWHTMLDALSCDVIDDTIKFHKAIGNKYVVVPWLNAPVKEDKSFDDECLDSWKEHCVKINKAAAKLAENGMFTGYHNHNFEFEIKHNGVDLFNVFFDNTDANVVVQLDTGNAIHGGADPVEVLKKYKDRSKTIHIKPFSKTNEFDTMIGNADDENDLKEMVKLCQEGVTEWYIVEYESEKLYEPLVGIKLCLEGFKKFI